MNTGYHVELAGGGYYDPHTMGEAIRTSASTSASTSAAFHLAFLLVFNIQSVTLKPFIVSLYFPLFNYILKSVL